MDIALVPGLLADRRTWQLYLETCDREDFFRVLKALRETRDQLEDIWKKRKFPNLVVGYKNDTHATSNYIPGMPWDD